MTLTNGEIKNDLQNGGRGGSILLEGRWINNVRRGHSILINNVHFISNKVTPSSFAGMGGWYTEGGAISAYGGASVHIRNSRFEDNSASIRGGAIIIDNDDSDSEVIFSVKNTIFYNNRAEGEVASTGGNTWVEAVNGGALFLRNLFDKGIYSTVFDSNAAEVNGECCNNQGGAINIDNVDYLVIENSKFIKNKIYTPDGNLGGNALGGAINITNYYNPVKIRNNIFISNFAEGGFATEGGGAYGGNGGALRIIHHDGSWPFQNPEKSKIIIVNNTFYKNSSQSQGQGIASYGAAIESNTQIPLVMFNNVFWENKSQNNIDISGVYNNVANEPSSSIAHNSFDKTEFAAIFSQLGEGNFSSDPKFVLDGSIDSLALSDASGMIGKGILELEGYRSPSFDILGKPRPTQLYNPDLGAYENSALISLYPDRVKNLQSDAGSRYVHLYWDENAENNISHYAIYMSTESNFVPTVEDSIGETSTTTYEYWTLKMVRPTILE